MTGLDRALMPAPIGRRHKGRKHNAVLPPDEPKTARRGGAASSWDDETRISFASLVTELQDADAQTASVLAQSFPTLTAHDFDYALERLWKARKDGVGPTGSKEPLESEAGFVVAVLRDIAYCYDLAQRLEKGDSLRFPLVTESCRDR